MYFYKTVNIVNGKFYYGIHRTNRLNDSYLGSGNAFRKALAKHGEQNFKKEILKFFDSEGELIAFESLIVDDKMVKNRQCYNILKGGHNPAISQKTSESLKEHWNSPAGKEMRKQLSIRASGYNNADFKKNWMPIYEEIKSFTIDLIENTTLPDKYIQRQIVNKFEVSIKFPRLLRYYEYCEYLNKTNKKIIASDGYFSFSPSNLTANIFKTKYNNNDKPKIFKAFIPQIIHKIPLTLEVLMDMTISNSMLSNKVLDIPNGRHIHGLYSRYLEYLGLITKLKDIQVDIRIRRPNSQRKWGTKTIYSINKDFQQQYYLVGENVNERYTIKFDGRTFQSSRI